MTSSDSKTSTKLILILIGTGAFLIGGFLFFRCRSDVSGLSYCSTLGLVNPGAYKDRGIERSKNGDDSGAIADFEKVIELNPKDADAFYRLGVISGDNQSDYDSGLIYLKKADAISPNENYKKKIAQFKNEKMRIATAELTRRIERNPSNANAYYDRGVAKGNSGDYQGAIADYSKAIAINPQHVGSYFRRGILRSDMGDFKGAISDYDNAIKIAPNLPGPYENRGLNKYYLKDYQGAILDTTEAIKINPNSPRLYNARCYMRFLSKDYKKALPDCDKAISLDGEFVYAFDSRASVKKALGDLRGACSDWKKSKELGYKDDKENQDKVDKNLKENCS